MNVKKLAGNGAVLVASVGISLLVCEVAARWVLNPADYLSSEMVADPILGAAPSRAEVRHGVDKWGFRNRSVPVTADIVAIGDSHTYGNTATMEDSWPYVVGRLLGRSVYNMGLGGYGPNQYFHLLKTKALLLKPRTVICGLYMGDDFENAYLITYGLDHWAYLRRLPARDVKFNIWQTAATPTWHKRIRIWLSQHSVAYQLAFHASVVGRFQGEAQIRNASRLYDSAATLNLPDRNILEAFLPKGMLLRLDQNNPAVQEGMRITFELLRRMNDLCRSNNVEFIVAVIPTKEMVFSNYLEHNRSIAMHGIVDALLINERAARARTFGFLQSSGIAWVDALPALQQATGRELYARTAADMHPSRNGYKVIAEAICTTLQHTAHPDVHSSASMGALGPGAEGR